MDFRYDLLLTDFGAPAGDIWLDFTLVLIDLILREVNSPPIFDPDFIYLEYGFRPKWLQANNWYKMSPFGLFQLKEDCILALVSDA